MITIIDGDLLKQTDCNVICHQANCINIMKGGIAYHIRNRFPEAYNADRNFYIPKGSARLGHFSVGKSDKHRKFIYNLYGQNEINSKEVVIDRTEYLYLEKAIEGMVEDVMRTEQQYKGWVGIIAFPYFMGCEKAGGDWNKVYAILERVSNKYNRPFYIYRLKK